MGREPLAGGFGDAGEFGQLTPELAWQALLADRNEGNAEALENLRPWLTASAFAMLPDSQMAALVAQQVLVDLTARTGQAIRSAEELEQWLRVRLTQTVALFTGSLGVGVANPYSSTSSPPSPVALGAGGVLVAWTRRLSPARWLRPPRAATTALSGLLAVGLVVSALAYSYSLGAAPPGPGPRTPQSGNGPGGVPLILAPIDLIPHPATVPVKPSVTPAPSQAQAPLLSTETNLAASTPTVTPTPPMGVPPKSPNPPPTPTPPVPTPSPTPPPRCNDGSGGGQSGDGGDASDSPAHSPDGSPVGLGDGDSERHSGVPHLSCGRSGPEPPDDSGVPNGPESGGGVLGDDQGAADRH